MPNFAPDRGDDARLALQDVVRDYGVSGLDNPNVFAQVLPDLLPGAPLASNLISAAAAAGVGRMLTERIGASIPADAAVRDVAGMLSQRSALDIAAAQWVVAEYARALGHPVDPSAAMSPPVPTTPVHQMPQAPPTQYMAGPAAPPVSAPPISAPPISGPPVSAPPQQFAMGAAAGGMPPGGGVAPVGEPNATQLDGGTPGQARYAAGRAAAPVQPNRGRILDDTAPFPATGPAQPGFSPPYQQPGFPQQPPGFPPGGGYGQYPGAQGGPAAKRSRAPWIIGGVVLVLVAAVVVGIVLVGGQKKNTCTGTACQTLPTHKPTVPVTTPPVTTPPVTTPPPSPTPPPQTQVALAQVMPKDIDVSTCVPDTQDLMDNVQTSLSCTEGGDSTLPGAAIFAYQFADGSDYSAGLDQLNGRINLDPATAGTDCPPTDGHADGVNVWHRSNNSKPSLGKIECFTDGSNFNYYIWTDDDELTIEIVKSTADQTFADLSTWWGANNNNSTGP